MKRLQIAVYLFFFVLDLFIKVNDTSAALSQNFLFERNPVTNHKFITFVNTLSSGENESTKQGHGRLLARSICCLANRYKNAVLDIISSVVFIL